MKEEVQDLIYALSFIDEITNQTCVFDKRKFDVINELSESFMEIYDAEKSRLPYHINILDLLWANENAHSRIFAELLNQNSENNYAILISFLKYLRKINQKFDQNPFKPKITSEKDRIDLLILDKEFALIIENKIHYAVDQHSQLARYIERVKDKGYRENQIFVVYLTRDGTLPESQSWKNQSGIDYKDNFSERFFCISFRYNILPWLEDFVLPNCSLKDVYLKSTIEQYIDHLKGMFNSRNINKKMNKELEEHIINVLDLKSTPEINHSIINKKIEELNKVKDHLDNLKRSSEKECWQKWAKNLTTDFPSFETFDKSNDKDHTKVGLRFERNGMAFSVLIETDGSTIYYGIGRHYSSETVLTDVQSFLKPAIDGFSGNGWWYGWKNTSYENGYSRLKALIEGVIKLN